MRWKAKVCNWKIRDEEVGRIDDALFSKHKEVLGNEGYSEVVRKSRELKTFIIFKGKLEFIVNHYRHQENNHRQFKIIIFLARKIIINIVIKIIEIIENTSLRSFFFIAITIVIIINHQLLPSSSIIINFANEKLSNSYLKRHLNASP